MNIFLIGYRGSGKTTVAKHLSAQLGCPWVDADVELERCAGKSITTIFAEDGEEAFRDLESRVVAQWAERDQTIVALGGGAVLRQENRTAIATGTTVWLQATAETLARRITADPTSAARRPSLTGGGSEAEISEVLAQRTEIYRQCADFQVDTEGKTPLEVADEIVSQLRIS